MVEQAKDGDVVGALAGAWRYPVKSMLGEPLELAEIGARGVLGDRVYALRDSETSKIVSAKLPRRWGALLQCQATYHAESGVEIELPNGLRVLSGSVEADATLSTFVGRAVSLVSAPPDGAEIERYWPNIPGLDLRDTVTSGEFAAGAPGTLFDFAPVHLLTTASLRRLSAHYPAGWILAARFRPNLVIETADEKSGWIENDWVEQTLLIGDDVRLRVISPTPRCIVPTLPQPGVPHDIGVLRAIADYNRPPIPLLEGRRQASFGVYALVARGGVVKPGDEVRVIRDV
jgi:uncharacterized protein YcbX